jgi:hypothetical protein
MGELQGVRVIAIQRISPSVIAIAIFVCGLIVFTGLWSG